MLVTSVESEHRINCVNVCLTVHRPAKLELQLFDERRAQAGGVGQVAECGGVLVQDVGAHPIL